MNTTATTVDEVIRWHDARELPDSDRAVLVYAPNVDEPVWVGFHDGDTWVTAELLAYSDGQVKAWADLPAGGVP